MYARVAATDRVSLIDVHPLLKIVLIISCPLLNHFLLGIQMSIVYRIYADVAVGRRGDGPSRRTHVRERRVGTTPPTSTFLVTTYMNKINKYGAMTTTVIK